MTDISIVTFTLGGREKYLEDCIVSSACDRLNSHKNIKIEHHIVLQGCKYPQVIFDALANISCVNEYTIIVHQWDKNIGIGAGLNKILPECKGKLIFKADDDCKIISPYFFATAWDIHNRFPTAIFSPTPTGLVNNMGGPPGIGRSIFHDKQNNKYYCLRHTSHVGGFARFSPKNSFVFSPDLISGISGTEDSQLSQWALCNNIPMFYVENGIVVEHNEGLAQQLRYPEYFKDRTGDLETFKRWIK